ncbi:MAG: hypothetical protein DRI46_12235, partial [Chloroflexi bacterium]
MAALASDFSNYVEDGKLKAGVSTDEVERWTDIVAETPIPDPDIVPIPRKVPNAFERTAKALRRFAFKEVATDQKAKFSVTEKADIISAVQGLFFEEVANHLGEQSLKDHEADFRANSLEDLLQVLTDAETSARAYAKSIGDSTDIEYKKATQYADLINDLLITGGVDETSTQYRRIKRSAKSGYKQKIDSLKKEHQKLPSPRGTFKEFLTKQPNLQTEEEYTSQLMDNVYINDEIYTMHATGVDRGLRALGYSISLEDVQVTEQQEHEHKESYTEAYRSIMESPVDRLTQAVKAKFMLYRSYEINKDDNPFVSRSLIGTPLRYDSAISNAAFLNVAFLLADDNEYTYENKVAMLSKHTKLIQQDPKGYLDHYFMVDLYNDLTGKGASPFTVQGLHQLNTVMSKDVNNMIGIDVVTRKDGTLSLLRKDFRYSTAFKKTMSSLKVTFDGLKKSGMVGHLLGVMRAKRDGTDLIDGTVTGDVFKFAEKLHTEEGMAATLATIPFESVDKLVYTITKTIKFLSDMKTGSSNINIAGLASPIEFNADTGSYEITPFGKKIAASFEVINKALAFEIAKRVQDTASLAELPLSQKSI